jgi:hypothetical protein
MMKRGSWVWLWCGAFSLVACGSSDDSASGVTNQAAFEGIYQLTGASENTASCASPGDSTLSQLRDQFFVITGSEIFGQKYVVLNSCNSVAGCQATRTAQKTNQPYQIEYTFTLSSSTNATTLNGFYAGTGRGEGTQCVERDYAEHVLTLAGDHSVHLESRTKNLADKPQKDGFCWVDPNESKQEAASKDCVKLEVLDGSFLQAD